MGGSGAEHDSAIGGEMVEGRRTEDAMWYFAGAILAFFFGLIMAGMSSDSPFVGAIGKLLLVLSGLALAIGFWVRLFGILEERMMDVQKLLAERLPVPEGASPAAPAKPANIADGQF